MQNNKKITRRTFFKKTGKLVYLAPVMYTFFTDTKEVFAQGRAAEAAARRAARLEALAAAGNQRAAQQLQRLRERLVSPP